LLFSLFYFGLDLFLLSQTSIASHAMGMDSSPMKTYAITIMNSAAFAPIPLMLLLSNKLTKAKGFKFTFSSAVASFVISVSFLIVAYKN
jgi:hypothetical protein